MFIASINTKETKNILLNYGPNFQTFFEALPGAYLIVTVDMRAVALSNEYLKLMGIERNQLENKKLFEVLPHTFHESSKPDIEIIRAAFHKVIETKEPQIIALRKYLVPSSQSEGSDSREKYLSMSAYPILSPSGDMEYIIHHVEDFTEYVPH